MNYTSILNPPISIVRPLALKRKFNLKAIWFLMGLLILSFLIVLVFQLNAYTKEIYLIQDYQQEISQLANENKILEINFSKANSLNNVGNFVENRIFEKAEKVDYIRLLESTVLAK